MTDHSAEDDAHSHRSYSMPVPGRSVTADGPASAAMRISAENARRFLVARHFLAPARSLQGGSAAVLEVVHRLGSNQYDPLAVAGGNHDLVLHARVADYEPGWSDLLYE